MHAQKLKVTIQEDHRVEVQLPADFPKGPAEIIVLTNQPTDEPKPGYEAAKARALIRLEHGYDLDWTPPTSRDELHDR